MFLNQYILRLQGEVNGVFDVVIRTDSRCREAESKDEEKIKEVLRRDREENLHGYCVPEDNPSQDSSVVEFFYAPTMEKQALYASGFPVQMGTYEIIDAFTCLGSRFGLKPLTVFVELCYSTVRGGRYWANIYYVADAQVPACTLQFDECSFWLDNDEMLERIGRDMQEDDRMRHISAEIAARKPGDEEAMLELMKDELAKNYGERPSIEDYSQEEIQNVYSRVRADLGLSH